MFSAYALATNVFLVPTSTPTEAAPAGKPVFTLLYSVPFFSYTSYPSIVYTLLSTSLTYLVTSIAKSYIYSPFSYPTYLLPSGESVVDNVGVTIKTSKFLY